MALLILALLQRIFLMSSLMMLFFFSSCRRHTRFDCDWSSDVCSSDLSLAEDPRLLVFGEDVGRAGGIFGVTVGLQAEFGQHRVFDTPISESAIVGAAVGLAFAGWRKIGRASCRDSIATGGCPVAVQDN